MSDTYLLRGARQLLTLRSIATGPRRGAGLSKIGVIENGALLFRHGRIERVGKGWQVENTSAARGAKEINVSGKVVMPAFIDPSVRLLQEELPYKHLNASQFKASFIQRFLPRSLAYGTTLFEVKSGCAGTVQDDLKHLRLLSRMKKKYKLDFITTWTTQSNLGRDDAANPNAIMEEHLREVAKHKLVKYVEVKCSKQNSQHLERFLQMLQQLGIETKLTTDEDDQEALVSLARQFRPIAIHSPRHFGRNQTQELADLPCLFVFNPGQDFFAGRKDSPDIRQFVNEGGAIALASGYHPEKNPSFSMQMVLAFAVLQMRLTIEEAITAATINAAYAVGQERNLGSLEKDKWADLLVLDLPDYRELPRQYALNHVYKMFRRGVSVFERRRPEAKSVTH